MKKNMYFHYAIALEGLDSLRYIDRITSSKIFGPEEVDGSMSYCPLLDRSGKVLYEFLLLKQDGALYIICYDFVSENLLAHLQNTKLDLDVQFLHYNDYPNLEKYCFDVMWDPQGCNDPRDKRLGGWSIDLFDANGPGDEGNNNPALYELRRMELNIPALMYDALPGKHFALDLGLDNINGISFDKGCYPGQEVLAHFINYQPKRLKPFFLTVDCGLHIDKLSGLVCDPQGQTIGRVYSAHKHLPCLAIVSYSYNLPNISP